MRANIGLFAHKIISNFEQLKPRYHCQKLSEKMENYIMCFLVEITSYTEWSVLNLIEKPG